MAEDQPQAESVIEYRWQWIPAVLVTLGVVIVWVCAFAARDALGVFQYGIYFGGLMALASAVWFRRRVAAAQLKLEAIRAEIAANQADVEQQQQDLATAQKEAESQLEQQAVRVDRREQALAHKLIAYREWMEFPQPIDLAEHSESDDELRELVAKDRRMIELLEEEAKTLFEKIRNNEYSVDGKFQPALLRDDAYELMGRVARIYQPDAKQPVLETSTAQVLHAASRACLHFLVVLDGLPVKVKDYNLNSMYGYIQQGVKAYGVYKAAAPYFPYINAAYQFGRLAMGASPATRGAWWVFGAMSKKGATALATKIVNRQALVLMHDLVRVIGFEVAGVYGGDFRHRDANWIYAAELADLLSRFPLSQRALSQGLKEIGALQLRSEYDRVFLYRLLAEHKSARPEQYRSRICLSAEQRQSIARRLEKFLAAFVDVTSDKQVERWQRDVASRLNVQIQPDSQQQTHPIGQQAANLVRSLASFLIGVKQCEVAELRVLLASTVAIVKMDDAERNRLFELIEAAPPAFFEQPEIEPASDLADTYIKDLIRLAVRTPPYDFGVDDLVKDCAAYLRQNLDTVQGMLDKEYLAYLAEQFGPHTLPKQTAPTVARAVLSLLENDDSPQFFYGGVIVEQPADRAYAPSNTWLLGVGDRLILFTVDEQPRLLWRGDHHVEIERSDGLITSRRRLTGGEWLDGSFDRPTTLSISASTLGGAESYFKPLHEFCETSCRHEAGFNGT